MLVTRNFRTAVVTKQSDELRFNQFLINHLLLLFSKLNRNQEWTLFLIDTIKFLEKNVDLDSFECVD